MTWSVNKNINDEAHLRLDDRDDDDDDKDADTDSDNDSHLHVFPPHLLAYTASTAAKTLSRDG